MPLRGRSQLKDQRIFFVTFTVKDFEPVFRHSDACANMQQMLFEVVKRHNAVLFGYVIMPHHLHLLAGLESGGPGLSRLVRDIKSLSWRRWFSARPGIWVP